MTKAIRNGDVYDNLNKAIGEVAEADFLWKPRVAANEATVSRNRTLFDMLFPMTAEFHIGYKKGEARQSLLLKDIEDRLLMDTSDGSNELPVEHACCNAEGLPCCSSLEEAKAKTTAAYRNWLMGRLLPLGTLAKWTHLLITLTTLCAAYGSKNILVPFNHFIHAGCTFAVVPPYYVAPELLCMGP